MQVPDSSAGTQKKKKPVQTPIDETLSLKAWEKVAANPRDWEYLEPDFWRHLVKAFPDVPEDKLRNVCVYIDAMTECAVKNLLGETVRQKFPNTPYVYSHVKKIHKFRITMGVMNNLVDKQVHGLARKPNRRDLTDNPSLA